MLSFNFFFFFFFLSFFLYSLKSLFGTRKKFVCMYVCIHSIRYQHWTNLPEVATGMRIVSINLRSSIPRFVMIHTYHFKAWYRGQPVSCDICKEDTHIAFNCPYKGKCLACKGSGHFARNCPTVC